MPDGPFVHAKVEVDRQLVQRAAVYHGGFLKGNGADIASVGVYDGLDTTGELIDFFYTKDVERHIYERGLTLRVGLYIDLVAYVSVFTAYYQPVPREKG